MEQAVNVKFCFELQESSGGTSGLSKQVVEQGQCF
jgi:hypothetical protein